MSDRGIIDLRQEGDGHLPGSHHSEKAIPGRHIATESQRDIDRSKIYFRKDFFAYLDYDEVSEKSSEELVELSSAEAGKNIAGGKFTSTGLKYKELTK